jgi:hypothetical protein
MRTLSDRVKNYGKHSEYKAERRGKCCSDYRTIEQKTIDLEADAIAAKARRAKRIERLEAKRAAMVA